MSAIRHYLIHMFAQGVGRIFATGSTILVFILAARSMSMEEFGQYSLIMVFVNVFAVLSQFGTNEAMGKAVVVLGRENMVHFLSNFLSMRLVMGCVVIVVGVIVALNVRDDLTVPLVICALGVPFVSMRFFDPLFQVHERPYYSVLSSIFYSTLLIAGSMAALTWSDHPLQALMVAYIFANICYFLASFTLLRRIVKLQLLLEKKMLTRIMWLAAPLGPAALYSILNSRVDIVLLSYLVDDVIVGLYSAAYRLVDFLSIGSIILVAPLIPIFSRMASKDRDEMAEPLARSYEVAAFFAMPFALIMPFVSPLFMVSLFGENYAEASNLINVLVWVVLVVLFSLLSSTANLALGAIKHGYWSGAIAVSVNVLLNFWWIPVHGAMGAAYATLISGSVWLLISHYYTHKELGNIIRLRFWLLLLGLNGLFWVLLYPLGLSDSLLQLVLAIVICFLCSVMLKLHPAISLLNFINKKVRKLLPV